MPGAIGPGLSRWTVLGDDLTDVPPSTIHTLASSLVREVLLAKIWAWV